MTLSAALPSPFAARARVHVPAQPRLGMVPGGVAPAVVRDRVQVARNLVSSVHLADTLQGLLRVRSHSGGPGEVEMAHLLQGRMARAGLVTDCWPLDLPALRQLPRFPGEEFARPEAWGLVGATGGDEGAALLLTTPVDVPPAPDALDAARPIASRDGRVYGPGAVDAKASLACQLVAIEALATAGVHLRGRLLFAPVAGGHDGGMGMFALLQRGYRADVAVVGMPTSNALLRGCTGSTGFRIHLAGEPGVIGAGTQPDLLAKYLLIHEALGYAELHRSERLDAAALSTSRSLPIEISSLHVDTAPGTSHLELLAQGRIAVAPDERVCDARQEIESVLAAVCAADPVLATRPARIEWLGAGQPGVLLQESGSLTRALVDAQERCDPTGPARLGLAPRSSDLSLLAEADIPALGYGPGALRDAHRPSESVSLEEMLIAARSLVTLVASYCGVHER